MRHRSLAYAVLFFAATAYGQTTDSLFVGIQAIDLSVGDGGGAASVELLHSFSPRTSVNAGVLHFSLAGSRWTYGRAGVTWKALPRLTLHGQADVGSGRAEESFEYRQFRGGVGFELPKGGIVLELEDQYVEVQKTRGNLVKLGAAFPLSQAVRAQAAVHTTTGGDLGSEFVTARVDWDRRAFDVFGGLSVGRSRPSSFDLVAAEGAAESFEEFFAGATVPIGTQHLTVALDYLVRKELRKASAIVSWKVPFK